MNVKGQVWCNSLHYAVILIKCNSLYSLTHSMIECVRSARDWWMLFSRCNNPRDAVLNNDQHIWLMSAVSSSWGESFRLSLLVCVVCDERSPFAGMMMIDTVRSQIFHWSLHTSWSLTSGISKMNGLPLSRTGEVIFSYAHVKGIVEERGWGYDAGEMQLNSDCWKW